MASIIDAIKIVGKVMLGVQKLMTGVEKVMTGVGSCFMDCWPRLDGNWRVAGMEGKFVGR